MAKIRFDANVPVEVALKFSEGKRVPSSIKGKDGEPLPDQMFFTLCGDDTMYVSLAVADQITALGIRKMELFSICKTVRNQVTKWGVKRMGDTATTPIVPATAAVPSTPQHDQYCSCPQCEEHWSKGCVNTTAPMASVQSMLENQLTRSIHQAQQQKANLSKSSPSAAVATVPVSEQTPQINSTRIHHTGYSRTMAAALIAAVDAAREAERYAIAVGFEVEFVTEDIRMMAATLFIAASKDPAFLTQPTQKVNGGTTWPQQ